MGILRMPLRSYLNVADVPPIDQLMKWDLTLEYGEFRSRIWPFGLMSVLIADLRARGIYER